MQGEETAEEPIAEMREAIDNGESVQVELRNYRKDGTEFWNQVTLAPLKDNTGTVTHYVGFQQDVSTQKAYEKQLEDQREDLRVLNEMVRHDIRNDLQVALAALEVLKANSDGDGTDSKQITTALESIHQAIDLTDTAKDIAEVMLETEAEYAPTALRAVLHEQVQQCQSAFPDVEVRANDMLDSVFRNLLTNGIVHNDTETPELLVTATTTDESVRITIADNGPGIPEEVGDRLFDRGWKGGDSGGTGIGLYIVSSLVENYGGSIEVRDDVADDASRPGELGGATFVVELPLAN
jgi:signal transduction histidine kinase